MIEDYDSRREFNRSWLNEAPENIGSFDSGNPLIDSIRIRIDTFNEPVINLDNLSMGLRKIQGPQLVFYWIEKDNEIQIAVELIRASQCVTVNNIRKYSDPKQPPYASDLYLLILQDQRNYNNISVRLRSDTQLTTKGFEVWARLFNQGVHISIYDTNNPGQSYRLIKTIDDLKSYFLSNREGKRYQYVLSEDGMCIGEAYCFFNTRRMRELGGLSLD